MCRCISVFLFQCTCISILRVHISRYMSLYKCICPTERVVVHLCVTAIVFVYVHVYVTMLVFVYVHVYIVVAVVVVVVVVAVDCC